MWLKNTIYSKQYFIRILSTALYCFIHTNTFNFYYLINHESLELKTPNRAQLFDHSIVIVQLLHMHALL